MTAHATGGEPDWSDPYFSAPGDDEFGAAAVPANDAPKSANLPAPAPPPWVARIATCTADWFQKPPPRRTWLLRDARTPGCDGALPLGKVGLLIGEGGVSKTMALVALLLAVSTGTMWLGAYGVATPGRVLALLGEEDAEEVPRRLFNARRAAGAPVPADGTIVSLPLSGLPCAMVEKDRLGNAQDAAFLTWLRAYVKEHGPFALVVVDPLSRFAGADAEIDNAAATRFVQALESIATETGATVMCAHHTNKLARGASGGPLTAASARGSSAITDGVRWAAALTAERLDSDDADVRARLGELVTLSIVKSNYSRKGDPLLLRRDHTNSGALVPLDGTDLEIISEARATADPTARRQAARAEQRQTRGDREDAAVLAVVTKHPGLGTRELRAAVMAEAKIGREPADDAIARALTDGRVTREGSKTAGYRHVLGVDR